MRRVLVIGGTGLAGALLVLLLLVAWGLGTQAGARALWNIAAGRVDGLAAGYGEGRIAGALSLEDLRFETDTLRLRVAAVELRWAPARLLRGELVVEALHLTEVDYTQLATASPDPDAAPFSPPERVSLPIVIELRDVALRAFEYRAAPDGEPLRVDEALLEAAFRESTLSIAQLSARGPLFQVEAAGEARTEAAYPVTLNVDWQATPPDLAPVEAALTVAGDLAELRIEQQLGQPYASTQRIDARDLLGELRFDARLEFAGTQLHAIGDTLPAATVSGALRAAGSVSDLSYAAEIDVASDDLGTLALRSEGDVRDRRVRVGTLRLDRQPGSASLRLSGSADLAGSRPAFAVEGSWRDLAWPLTGEARLGSATGEFSLRGNVDDYAVALNAALAAPGYTDGELMLQGRGGRESFELADLTLEALGGSLSGNGRVRFGSDLHAAVELEGAGLDPAVLAPAYPGDLQLALRAEGGSADGSIAATVENLTIDGSFRGQPVALELTGSLRDERVELEVLHARSGQTRISAVGHVDEELDLEWTIDSPDLGDVLPGATGSLAGAGQATGSIALPALRADLAGEAIAYAGYALERLDLAANVDLERVAPSKLTLTVEGARLPGDIDVRSARLEGTGNRHDHRLALRVDASEGAASLALRGDLRETHWQGELSWGEFSYGAMAPWQLAGAQPLRIGADEVRLERGCWRSDASRLCLAGSRVAGALQADFSLSAFDLAYLRPLLPPSIALDGTIEAQGRASQPADGQPSIAVTIDANGVEVRTGPDAQPPDERVLSLAPSKIRVDYGDDGLLATASLPFSAGGGIEGEARVDAGGAPLAERRLRGSLALALDDLGPLEAFSPEIDAAGGTLRGDLALAGTLAAPRATGEIRLADGSLALLTPGLTISDIAVRAASRDGRVLAFEGTAASGGGMLRIDGEAQLDATRPSASVNVAGEGFEVANTADARVWVSPDLQIALRETGISVNGEVRVPRAEITPQELPRSVVTASDDEVIVRDGDTAGDAGAPQAVNAKVRVVLGDAVSVDGFGFKGRLDGALTVTQRPGQPVLGSGEINILNGEYRAYGQGLVIDQGQIVFAGGPITQPGINVRALRRPAEGIVVGVRVRGPLEEPDFNVFSEPAMTQSEQLSWLVLGRPLNGASEGEGNMIAQAAIALGLKGGNVLADRLGDDLGVDTIGIETGSGEAGAASNVNEAALVVGKYLSPGLYVSYGIGLFDAISTVRLEYSLGEHWKVSSESSTLGSGGDVTYTIER